MFEVLVPKQVIKAIIKMPKPVQIKMMNLVEDLQKKGPFRNEWPNYSKLSDKKYHCHFSEKWVACWQWEKKSIVIEVYYAGSRENATY
jgi:hypothetical protein